MIHQINILTGLDKVETAIKRFQTFEPPEGYYLAFSGGKDSVVIKALADMAGVKYDAHYTVASVDPPELVQFIKEHHADVSRDIPHDKDGNPKTMWSIIAQHTMPPIRTVRYCCRELKEDEGGSRFKVTGVRWEESTMRKAKRKGLELSSGKFADPDNPDNAEMARYCPTKGHHILNPIIDWTTEEIWEFIHECNIPYCGLYDEGRKRLGCIGCPMASARGQLEMFERWPKYYDMYLRAFRHMIENAERKGHKTSWKNEHEVFEWWITNNK